MKFKKKKKVILYNITKYMANYIILVFVWQLMGVFCLILNFKVSNYYYKKYNFDSKLNY